jgi:hypothetical protein
MRRLVIIPGHVITRYRSRAITGHRRRITGLVWRPATGRIQAEARMRAGVTDHSAIMARTGIVAVDMIVVQAAAVGTSLERRPQGRRFRFRFIQ